MINNAKQIWLDTFDINQYAELIHPFSLTEIAEGSTLYIYCESEYVVSINDTFIGSGQYKTFDNKRVYDTYDVSAMLKSGNNEIFITACHHGTDTQTYASGMPGVAFALVCGDTVIISGENSLIRPSTFYRSGEMEMCSPQLGYTYYYNASAKALPWQSPRIMECTIPFVDRPIKRLVHMPVIEGSICTQGLICREQYSSVAETMQKDYLSYRDKEDILDGMTVKMQESGAYIIIDLGNEYAGLFCMDLNASEGTKIDIGYGEHLDDLRVRTYVGERCFASSYICKTGNQSFTGYFRRIAGRYIALHITNMTGNVSFNKVGLIPTCYPLTNKEQFRCNDYFYNRLFDVSVKTLKLCMHEHYEDCPWREQALYAFDSFVQMRCGYYAYGEYEFARASLELMADSQWENGLLELSSPGRRPFTIPSFALSWVMSLQHYVLYSGDVEFGTRMLPVAEKILKFFSTDDSLVIKDSDESNWYFYEWSDGGTDGYGEYKHTYTDALINFYYILACESFNKLCVYSGHTAKYDLEPLRRKSYDTFYNAEKGLFRTFTDKENYHELTQVLAILAGVIDRDSLAPVLIDKNNNLIKITLSTSIYKYDALLKDDNRYIEFVTDDIAEIWGDMIYSGANSLWETSVGAEDFSNAGSLCHAWSAVPVYVLYRYHIGLKPLEPGFKTYEIHPCTTESVSKINAKLYMPGKNLEIKIEEGKIIKE